MQFTAKRLPLLILTTIILFSSFGNSAFSYDEHVTIDIGNLPFKQKITIPIDTSLDKAKFQPVDIHVKFDHSCWAQDEINRSVRVGYDDGSGVSEIESQIYDLEHTDNSHINTCNIVFLIPQDANGKEKYYILYSDSETSSPEYLDHLSVEDAHYHYEPISGQIIDFDYYKIIEDGYIIYGICQRGELLGNGMSNTAIKLVPNSTQFETTYADQIACLYMSYSTDPPGTDTGSAWAIDISKSIVVDGNLMIRLRIKGVSPDGIVKTDNIYTYYYSPISTKSLNINVNHDVLKTYELKGDKEKEGTYASLATIKARSATIKKMNVGNILPQLNFYGEDDSVKQYSIPTNPDANPAEWILTARDDNDLGSKAWVCMDDPSTGKTHALIFQSNKGYLKGDEDGIQIKASTQQHVKLPGLEADSGDVFAIRNAYENGKHDTVLPEGMNVTFNIEFITFESGGYKAVDVESGLYQKMVADRPINRGNVSNGEKNEKERYSLTVYVHLAPSVPLGSVLSAVLGKNISYVTAELYKDTSLVSSGSAGRLPLGAIDLDFKNTTLVQKIKMTIGLFDWKNASFFKKIRFPNLESGTYLIKIYKENPLLGKEQKYIGYTVVDLKGKTSAHIYCRPEGKTEFSIKNQDKSGIENVQFSLLSNGTTISSGLSNKNGSIILKAPCYRKYPYVLHVIYDGFLVDKKQIRLSLKNSIRPLKESFSTSLYKLEVNVKDTFGLSPSVDINPMLTSSEMIDHIFISPEEQTAGRYTFTMLYPAGYILRMGYKSFVKEINISLDKDKSLNLEFPAEFTVNFDIMNSYGMKLSNAEISLTREGKTTRATIRENGTAVLSVPPGEYSMVVSAGKEEIAKQNIDVKGDKLTGIVTSQGSSIHAILLYFSIIFAILSIMFIAWRRNIHIGLKLFTLALVLIAIFSPWWTLTGSNGVTSTTTQTLLVPSNLVTLTSSNSVIGGEISAAPAEFTMILNLLAVLLFVVFAVVVFSIILEKRLQKTSKILSIIAIILTLLVVLFFFYAMSQVTDVGVGSFLGNGNLDTSIPGLQKNIVIPCSWGPGTGFYLGILAIVLMVIYPLLKLTQKYVRKIQKTH